ncbi:uncharacterized protein LOC100892038 [Strongylocentrotus purpuratus]|uniref:Death domain-containing protein n=1 Tax=Strongylocentrotus purpuratus TaxID=7668 RepID=A0A7M7GG66_STRPU|nr:uncharacterized protein LOC100892038 [Strongylocentrotus purpuratus]|eukprot:XP_003726882.1 PREDICTED: uncharacterized protein LOC100892038 [Strongylocentrotus purpuratus]
MDLTPLEINQIANLVDINVVRKLGLHLGLAHAEIQRYEKTNNQNPSQCTGTEDMLVAWHRNGGTREMLCRALGVVEQTRLAFRIESGEFRAEPVAAVPVAAVPVAAVPLRPNSTSRVQTTGEPEAALHVQSTNSNSQRPRQGKVAERVNIEYVIPRLAEDINNSCVGKLGQALNFRPAQINRYESTNHMTGRVTVKGTTSMLYDWKSRTSVRVQKEELRAALIQAEMIEIADEHLPLE